MHVLPGLDLQPKEWIARVGIGEVGLLALELHQAAYPLEGELEGNLSKSFHQDADIPNPRQGCL